MTHFRLRFKQMGFMRWRLRTAGRQTTPGGLPLGAFAYHAPSTAPWWRTVPAMKPLLPETKMMELGELLISNGPQLGGHPDIRY